MVKITEFALLYCVLKVRWVRAIKGMNQMQGRDAGFNP